MEKNTLTKVYGFLKRMLVYQPPQAAPSFVLSETDVEQGKLPDAGESLRTAQAELEALLRYAKRLEAFTEKAYKAFKSEEWLDVADELKLEYQALTAQQQELTPILLSYDAGHSEIGKRPVSSSLEENRRLINMLYQLPENKDVVIREVTIPANPPVKTLLIFIDGLVDGKLMNLSVLQPLMLLASEQRQLYGHDLVDRIMKEYLPTNQIKRAQSFQDIQDGINGGDTAIFFDGVSEAILVGTKGWEHRSVDRPQTEQSVRGSQAAFSENLRINTGLIRIMLRSSDLITQMIKVGTRGRMTCAVMYIKSIANPILVDEIIRRIKSIETDYINDTGVLEQFIEDHPNNLFPQMLSTERPDRVTAALSEGRVAIILDGSPFVHIAPVSFFSFFHSAEDYSMNGPSATFMRLIRLAGTLLATILPAMYLGINYFHQEALPTELALAIAGAHENVPFSAFTEIILMEAAFELIREAGLRVPGLLGPTIGIVGAIILGQAAVAAHIVSPIMVVIIAVTGLASFTIPEYRMSVAVRMWRFILLALSAFFGLVGVAGGLLVATTQLCSLKSFGMPYMAPVSPKTITGLDVVMRGPVYRQERRPDALNTQDEIRQPNISRKWTQEAPAGGEQE